MNQILTLREKRAKAWDAAKAFLDTKRGTDGLLSAEDVATYEKMEADVVSLDKEIDRLERQANLDRELSQPTTSPITNQPAAGGKAKDGRASDEYTRSFWALMRNKSVSHEVYNALKIGQDDHGGFLAPDEFQRTLLDALQEQNIFRQLAHVITTSSGDRKIPVVASKGTAAWIDEEAAYCESTDASTWGVWTALTVVSSTATSGSQSISPSSTAGTYRRFRIRIQGTAGETYYSAWLVSSNSVRRNIPPTAPTVFTASPAVYDTGTISLAWSDIVAGTSTIKQVVIQQATSADGVTWGAYEALTTITTTATSGSYEATPSSVSGMSTRYRLSVTDTLNAISAYALSNVVRKVSPPTVPVVTAPKVASQTYTNTPRFLITTGTRLGGGMQKVCVKIGTAEWEDTVANPERFSTSGTLANGVPTIYTPVALAPGNYTVTFRSVDSGSEAVSPEVVRSFMVLASTFEEIVANVTKVKAAHMRGLRTAVNNVRDFYGMSTISWSEDIVSGKTYVKNWPFHVLELRKAIEQVVDAINAFDVAWANKLPDPAWISFTTGRPQAVVMQQLQTLILGL